MCVRACAFFDKTNKKILNNFCGISLHHDCYNRGDEEYKNGPAGMEPEGVIESNWNEVVDNFDDMNLKEELLRGIYAYGFERPSAIQQRAILPCIKEHDVIAQAQSGMLIVSSQCIVVVVCKTHFSLCQLFD